MWGFTVKTILFTTAFAWISLTVGAAELPPGVSTNGQGVSGLDLPWSVEPGFKVEVVATGFQLPVNIAFLPNPGNAPSDPYFYVTELYGSIKVVTRDFTVSDYAVDLLDFLPSGVIPGSGEQGLTGIVIDPATGDLFISKLYDSPFEPGIHYPMVLRLHSVDGGMTASSASVVLDMFGEAQGEAHQVSKLSFGPDGMLYVHMGDGFISSTGQDISSFRGKILRMHPDGSPAADNPFFFSPDGINATDYIYAYGFRNPFGGAWRAADGILYYVGNGPFIDRFAQVIPGRNFAWDGTDASMLNFALYSWYPASAPVNLAFVQAESFGGSGFPLGKLGRAYVTESGLPWVAGPAGRGKRISEFTLAADGTLLDGPRPFVEYTGTGRASTVALAAGPDGLYFSDFYKDQDSSAPTERGANVLRVRFVGSADFTADVTSGVAPLTVQFSDLSMVAAPTSWAWDFGDGATSVEQHPQHTYTSDGLYSVELSVTSAEGTSVIKKSGFIEVGNVPRVAFVVGGLPPAAGDSAVADFVRALGWVVDFHDDEVGSRPTSAALAATYDAVFVSSSVDPANIGGDFRYLTVPVAYWASQLNALEREPLAAFADVPGSSAAVSIIDTTHAITEGLDLGSLQVYGAPGNVNGVRGPIGDGVRVLAMSGADPDAIALMTADVGAALLGGHVALSRRVFLFLDDDSWLSMTPAGKSLFGNAFRWALGPYCAGATEVLYVDSRAPVAGDCLSWGSACRDFQDALDIASSRENPIEIWVATGVYYPDRGSGLREATFVMQDCVGWYGGFRGAYGTDGFAGEAKRSERDTDASPTVLSGDIGVPDVAADNSYHVVSSTSNGPTAVMDGFLIVSGNADGNAFPFSSGGGLLSVESSPSIAQCLFASNSAINGGAVHHQGGRATIKNCAFIGNSAVSGAGLSNGAGIPILSRCTFLWNFDTVGCGVSDWLGLAVLDNSDFLFNVCSIE